MSRFVLTALSLLLTVMAIDQVQARQAVTYFYDELGRLVGVVDPNGESAAYTYDSVGNLLSIARRPANQVSVVEFTPNGGPATTQVTVYGTAFSATPAQNTVKFNGVTATIASSSATQIVASVPAGATTGPIQVISPSGSATSSASFTVGPTTLPAVTGFTPSVGVTGTVVTISGSNFDTVPANDKVQFNARPGMLTAATATSLTAKVPPSGTSGHLAVETYAGKAISAGDFFIPPTGFAESDVNFTGRMAIGATAAVSIGTASKIGLMVFDGTVNHRLSVVGVSSTAGSSTASILKPNAVTLVSPVSILLNGFIDATTLPETGTYTILVDPVGTAVENMNVTLYDVPSDYSGSITPGGLEQTVTLSTPGQNGSLTFSGTSGQRVSLRGTDGTSGLYNLISVIKPDGTTLVPPTSFVPNGFIDATSLPATGNYALHVDPLAEATGSSTLTLYNVPADFLVNTFLAANPVLVPLGTPGLNGGVTFSVNSLWMNGSVTVHVTNSTLSTVTVKLLSPTGAEMTSTTSASTNFNLATVVFTTPGTHTVVVDPFSFNTGQANVDVTAVPPGGGE